MNFKMNRKLTANSETCVWTERTLYKDGVAVVRGHKRECNGVVHPNENPSTICPSCSKQVVVKNVRTQA